MTKFTFGEKALLIMIVFLGIKFILNIYEYFSGILEFKQSYELLHSTLQLDIITNMIFFLCVIFIWIAMEVRLIIEKMDKLIEVKK